MALFHLGSVGRRAFLDIDAQGECRWVWSNVDRRFYYTFESLKVSVPSGFFLAHTIRGGNPTITS
jgi:hypothetical protein